MKQKPLTNHEIKRAMVLRRTGSSWADIGRLVAAERGRRTPYTPKYMSRIVLAHETASMKP